MLYLIDANVLIDAKNRHFQMTRVREFWDWLLACAIDDQLKIPKEIYDEIASSSSGSRDDLEIWARAHEADLVLDEQVDRSLLNEVTENGYGPKLTDEELVKIGNDPFLIAYARAYPQDVTIITTEVSKPSKQRANRHIPDVCATFGVRCGDTIVLIEELDFTTGG